MPALNLIIPLVFAIASLVAIFVMSKIIYQSIRPYINFPKNTKDKKVVPIKIVKSKSSSVKPEDKDPDDIIYH
jgi:hypothetical protein